MRNHLSNFSYLKIKKCYIPGLFINQIKNNNYWALVVGYLQVLRWKLIYGSTALCNIVSSKKIRFNIISEHTFCTERSVPAWRTFAHERCVSAFTDAVSFVLALEFGAWRLLVTRVSGELLSDETDIYTIRFMMTSEIRYNMTIKQERTWRQWQCGFISMSNQQLPPWWHKSPPHGVPSQSAMFLPAAIDE